MHNKNAGVLIVHGWELLLGLRSTLVAQPGTWSFPGGAVNPGETPLRAAVREFTEETAMKIPDPRVLKYIGSYNYGLVRFDGYIGFCKSKFNAKTNWETIAFRWFDIDHLPGRLHFGFKKLLPQIRKAVNNHYDLGT